jgi:hypothetical protein
MKPRILLVNPPIYDFAAFDFWLKPYGMLEVAGFLRGQAEFTLFDFMDRLHPVAVTQCPSDEWGRGRFMQRRIAKPACLRSVPRYFRRFGLPRDLFIAHLQAAESYDYCLIQTVMTYWYPGVKEVIEDVRRYQPRVRIILGGNYVTLCPDHAWSLDSNLVVTGMDLGPLWATLGLSPDTEQPALWECYPRLNVGAIKVTEGCPFNCTYCSVQQVYGTFHPRSLDRALQEFDLLQQCGVKHIAFYDDALLYKPEEVLLPFLDHVSRNSDDIAFHCPNALNARFITRELATRLVQARVKTFYLGFESASDTWQQQTGNKVTSAELETAVACLKAAGADPMHITAYQILGHPSQDIQQLQASMHFVHDLGISGMLADFSPIPGTPDGDLARTWVDMDEPFMHNKTAFPILLLGFAECNRFKDLQRRLNREVRSKTQESR